MARWIVLCAAASLLASCDNGSEGSKPLVMTPGDSKTAPAEKSTTPDGGLGQLKNEVAKTSEPAKETAATSKESAAEVAATAKDAPKDLPDLKNVTESSFSLEKLKGAVASMNADSLKTLADQLVGALQGKTELLKSIQDQISKLGVTDLAKGADLKKQVEGLGPVISDLKAKLTVVVDKLKAGGLDVSKYTSLLTGP